MLEKCDCDLRKRLKIGVKHSKTDIVYKVRKYSNCEGTYICKLQCTYINDVTTTNNKPDTSASAKYSLQLHQFGFNNVKVLATGNVYLKKIILEIFV